MPRKPTSSCHVSQPPETLSPSRRHEAEQILQAHVTEPVRTAWVGSPHGPSCRVQLRWLGGATRKGAASQRVRQATFPHALSVRASARAVLSARLPFLSPGPCHTSVQVPFAWKPSLTAPQEASLFFLHRGSSYMTFYCPGWEPFYPTSL